MRNYAAVPRAPPPGGAPAVVVLPDWDGVTEYEVWRARVLASEGEVDRCHHEMDVVELLLLFNGLQSCCRIVLKRIGCIAFNETLLATSIRNRRFWQTGN